MEEEFSKLIFPLWIISIVGTGISYHMKYDSLVIFFLLLVPSCFVLIILWKVFWGLVWIVNNPVLSIRTFFLTIGAIISGLFEFVVGVGKFIGILALCAVVIYLFVLANNAMVAEFGSAGTIILYLLMRKR